MSNKQEPWQGEYDGTFVCKLCRKTRPIKLKSKKKGFCKLCMGELK